jgi:hypothetical protein
MKRQPRVRHDDLSGDRSRPLRERGRPDLVVYEITERYLGWVLRERGSR